MDSTLFKLFWPMCTILSIILIIQISTTPRSTNEITPRVDTGAVINVLPLSFVANTGQSHSDIHFTVRSLGGTLLFSPQEVVLNLNDPNTVGRETKSSKALSIIFENGSPDTFVQGDKKQKGITNYFAVKTATQLTDAKS